MAVKEGKNWFMEFSLAAADNFITPFSGNEYLKEACLIKSSCILQSVPQRLQHF